MAPKSQPLPKAQDDTVLHAVILADPYGHTFGPVALGSRGTSDFEWGEVDTSKTKGKGKAVPWCLLPLGNVPLLAWTLEALASSNVQKVYVMVNEGLEQVQAWFNNSPFPTNFASFQVVIRPTTALTQGDALRDVDSLAIPGDFILAKVGYIGNINLEAAVHKFAERKRSDRGLVMECLLTPSKLDRAMDCSTYVLGPNSQLLHYETSPIHPRTNRIKLPKSILEGAKNLSIRTDLENVGIDICSNEVPPLFSENFDYQSIRPHFIVGVLTSDLLGKTLACSVVENFPGPSLTFGMAIENPKTYDLAVKAILSRCLYPYVPDEMLPGSEERYEARQGRLYLGSPVDLARSARVEFSQIGRRTSVGLHSTVNASTCGTRCYIGVNCTLNNAYLFDNVQVADSCTIEDSIVASSVEIGKKCQIRRGCLVGPGVVLGEGSILEDVNVASYPWPEEVPVESHIRLGKGSTAHIWPSNSREDEDSDDEFDPRNLSLVRLGHRLAALELSSESSVSSISRSGSEASLATSALSTELPTIANVSALKTDDDNHISTALRNEVVATLDRTFTDQENPEDIAIELKTLRMATNVQLSQVRGIALAHICDTLFSSTHPKITYPILSKHVQKWSTVFSRLSSSHEPEMIQDILSLQFYLATQDLETKKLFPLFLRAFYDIDLWTEEGIIGWFKSSDSKDPTADEGGKVRQFGSIFVKALIEAEEDGDSDEG